MNIKVGIFRDEEMLVLAYPVWSGKEDICRYYPIKNHDVLGCIKNCMYYLGLEDLVDVSFSELSLPKFSISSLPKNYFPWLTKYYKSEKDDNEQKKRVCYQIRKQTGLSIPGRLRESW